MTQEPKDKFIELNNLRFHYLDWGNEGAMPLVALHGYTSHAHSWDTFARSINDDFHVLALDQRGHGESAWTDDYRPERMVEDMAAFVQALDLPKFVLVGLSMGGRNAYAYAAQYPALVEKLVIVDIGPELMAQGSARIRNGVLQNDVFADVEEAFQAARTANARPPDDELRRRVGYNLMPTADGKLTYRYDKALRAPDRPLPRPDTEAAWAMLRRISCPTLLVRGGESDLLSVEVAERMTREIPDCKLVTVPDAGHSVPLDNPQGFIAAVKPFLK